MVMRAFRPFSAIGATPDRGESHPLALANDLQRLAARYDRQARQLAAEQRFLEEARDECRRWMGELLDGRTPPNPPQGARES
jgi:hypothetical protein